MSCRFLRFGRSAVGHRLPAVRVGRRDPALLRRAPSVHLAQARRRTIPGQRPRSRAGQRLRLRLQRHRDRRRLDPYPRLETAGQDVRVAGLHGGTSAGAFRLPDERLQVRRTPHGGLAFGFDRLCSLFGGSESIRDYIAFPKNNNGRDMMLDAPGYIDQAQLDELHIQLVKPEE